MSRCARRSISPRNAITTRNVATSDQGTGQPLPAWKTAKIPGLVRAATNVAARVSMRHWAASAAFSCERADGRMSGSRVPAGGAPRGPSATRDAEHEVRRDGAGARGGDRDAAILRGVGTELESTAALGAGPEEPEALGHRSGVPRELALRAADSGDGHGFTIDVEAIS